MWILLTIWIFTGVSAVIWDWTRDFDLKLEDSFPIVVFGAFIGPVALLLIIPKMWGTKVIFKKRKDRSDNCGSNRE